MKWFGHNGFLSKAQPMAKPHYDCYRPHTEPAATIYDAFQCEASKRKNNKNWIELERHAVYFAACGCAKKFGLREPTMKEVERAENDSIGSADYGSKWAIKVGNIMKGVE